MTGKSFIPYQNDVYSVKGHVQSVPSLSRKVRRKCDKMYKAILTVCRNEKRFKLISLRYGLVPEKLYDFLRMRASARFEQLEFWKVRELLVPPIIPGVYPFLEFRDASCP